MTHPRIALVVLAAAVLIPLTVCRADDEPPASDDLPQKIEAYLESCADVESFSGAALVSKGDETIFAKGYGLANAEHAIPNTPHTKFRLGSVTKQFTAVLTLILAEQGKLSLDDPVSKHFAEAPPTWEKITLRHLLSHTSGIPNFTSFPDFRERDKEPSPPQKTILLFKDKPLDFEPGEKFAYSNSGYVLMGAILETVGGKPYAELLKEHVFDPLQLANTGYDLPETVIPERASGYRRSNDGLTNTPYVDMLTPHAAGALYSTVEDLALWDRALRAGKLMSPPSYEAMFTPVKDDYALGWIVRKFGSYQRIGHGGGINGFVTSIERVPEEGLCAVVLSNVEGPQPHRMAHDLVSLCLGETYKVPKKREIANVDPVEYDALAGKYAISPFFVLTIRRDGERLMVQATNQPEFELFPESPTEYFLKVVDAQISFVKDDQGKVASAVLHQNGRDMPAKRIEDTPPKDEEKAK